MRIFCGIFAFLVVGWYVTGAVAKQKASTSPTPSDSESLLEAAIRLALDGAVSGALPCEFYFVSVGKDKDPSPELLKRLNTYPHPVKAYSKCRKHNYRIGGITNDYEYLDRLTKGRGIKITASIIEWLSPTSAKVSYGWDQYSLASKIVSAEMVKRDGKWVVKKILLTIQT